MGKGEVVKGDHNGDSQCKGPRRRENEGFLRARYDRLGYLQGERGMLSV